MRIKKWLLEREIKKSKKTGEELEENESKRLIEVHETIGKDK